MSELKGRIVLVTGATAGIGRVTARELAQLGAHLVIVGRNPEKTRLTAESLRKEAPNSQVELLVADLSSLSDVRRLAADFLAKYPRLDVLVNNAGAVNPSRETTADGLERTFATNHLAYFLLTNLLLPALEKSASGRIVNVASEAHRGASLDFDDLQSERGYRAFRVYSRSKLANLLFTRELARRLEGTKITVNALHPGFVASSFMDKPGLWGLAGKASSLFAISVEEGARTSVYLASSPEVEGVSGKYFAKSRSKAPSDAAEDDASARRLWEISEQLTALTPEHRASNA